MIDFQILFYARRAATQVMHDLHDRRGLKWEMGKIQTNILEQMEWEIAVIIYHEFVKMKREKLKLADLEREP